MAWQDELIPDWDTWEEAGGEEISFDYREEIFEAEVPKGYTGRSRVQVRYDEY